MLPRVIDEQKIYPFKFWFSQQIQNGMSYRGELFCRLQTTSFDQRARLYQTACRLSRRGANVVVTVSDATCSLWINLRSQSLEAVRQVDSTILPASTEQSVNNSIA